MRRVCLTFATLLIAAACAVTQEPSSQGRASVSQGDRTITGCVAMGASGYVLNTDEGRTLPLRAGGDLSSYVGKKVQIHATWTATGVRVAGPLETEEAGAAPAAPAGGKQTGQAFAGDVRLKFQGKVVGDCLGKK